MSKRSKRSTPGTMLELWRPPQNAGDPVGCLATTYTFKPGLFDEQCLARFLEIESEPNREDLAFLLERETRLGGVYAGVLVDHTQAGVEHSLRWDVLPVRLRGKQHAKVSLLAWTRYVRIIVASANLTEAGYRFNHEVAIALDSTPAQAQLDEVEAACEFLRCLLAFVPGAAPDVPGIRRALAFLDEIDNQISDWRPRRTVKGLRQHLVFTLPGREENPATGEVGFDARSALGEAIARCRKYGRSPNEAWIASPFFDECEGEADAATASLCKAMVRGATRRLTFCIPAIGESDARALRLAAPASLLHTPDRYSAEARFEVLPQHDRDKNARPWHAKMLALLSDRYSALVAGSSNFTRAGLGIGSRRNAEANVLIIAERRPHAREPRELEAVWPDMHLIDQPEEAEWQGPRPEFEEEEVARELPLPAGFLSATYRAGDERQLVLRLDPSRLPEVWSVRSCGQEATDLLDSHQWLNDGSRATVGVPWRSVQPPEMLLVRWPAGEAFWALNVEDAQQLPPPAELAKMSADDMLLILAASDPSAAFRAWAKRQQAANVFDDELDSAMPTDLDPLRRYDLRTTFLRRIRSRARILARLRQNLERPAFSVQVLQWRMEGFIGIKPLAERLAREVAESDGKIDEALLTLADFLIVLREVDYAPTDGALPKAKFDRIYRSFLQDLVRELDQQVLLLRGRIGGDLLGFWTRTIERCRK